METRLPVVLDSGVDGEFGPGTAREYRRAFARKSLLPNGLFAV